MTDFYCDFIRRFYLCLLIDPILVHNIQISPKIFFRRPKFCTVTTEPFPSLQQGFWLRYEKFQTNIFDISFAYTSKIFEKETFKTSEIPELHFLKTPMPKILAHCPHFAKTQNFAQSEKSGR